MTNESERPSPVHPSIAGFVAAVRALEDQLPIFEDPTQYVQVLELGAKVGNERKPIAC